MNREKQNRHLEAVTFDNKFHQQLSGVRNNQVMDNHPDIELLKQERRMQQKKAIATLYNLTAMPDTATSAGSSGYSGPSGPGGPASQPQPMPTPVHQHPAAPSVIYHNVEFVLQYLEKETRRANKFARPMSIFVIAFSDLVPIASLHGVDAYELCLRFAGAAVNSYLEPDIDIVGLFANDRLLIVLPETHGAQATALATNMRNFFHDTPIEFKRTRIQLKPSIGIACFPLHGRDWKELLARADLAADAVVQAGGNAFAFAGQ